MELVQQQEENREAKVYRVAAELYRQDPDWVTFFREVLGVEGIIRQVFAEERYPIRILTIQIRGNAIDFSLSIFFLLLNQFHFWLLP